MKQQKSVEKTGENENVKEEARHVSYRNHVSFPIHSLNQQQCYIKKIMWTAPLKIIVPLVVNTIMMIVNLTVTWKPKRAI